VTFQDFREYLYQFAWFWPGLLVTGVLGVVLGRPVGRALKVHALIAMCLVISIGLIVSATLTPSREAVRFGTVGLGSCDFSRVSPPSWAEFLSLGDPTFNVLLFIPLGMAIGFFPLGRRQLILAAGAAALPLVIETIQLVAKGLDRACQSEDVVDNLTGLVVGLGVGLVIRLVANWVNAHDPEGGPSS
jgi:glycopeptide antibiotics resistance protein